MIYLVGGCSRSGKTTLARRLLAERGLPYFGTDYLMRSLQAARLGGISAKDDDLETAQKLQETLIYLVSALGYDNHDYLLEGVHLTAKVIRCSIDNIAHPIRGCLLGYPGTAPADKLAALEAQGRADNDWLRSFAPEAQLGFLQRQSDISRQQRQEAAESGIAFFDSGADFDAALDDARRELLNLPSS